MFGSLGYKQKSFNENSLIKPSSPYSASKASADHLVRSYQKTFNLKTIITHSSNNFGERQHPEKLIPLAIFATFATKRNTSIWEWKKHKRLDLCKKTIANAFIN